MRLKTLILSLFLMALAGPALAHDFWAGTAGPGQDGKLTVFIGFGHNFPVGEITAEEADGYELPKVLVLCQAANLGWPVSRTKGFEGQTGHL